MYKNILSYERLKRYKLNANDSQDEIIFRYLWNIRLSEAFYPALSLFEITLRNKIDYAISKNINDNWLSDKHANIMTFDAEMQTYEKTVSRLRHNFTKGQLIAELNLGFWVGLFKNKYNTVLWDKPNIFSDVFPCFPEGLINRKKIVQPKIRKIHGIRNRIFHHEPIFDVKNGLDNCYRDLEQVLYWLSPEARNLFDKINRFYGIWKECAILIKK